MKADTLPYFDLLLEQIQRGNRRVIDIVGLNVHWGYWDEGLAVDLSPEGIREASDALTRQLFREADLRDGARILDVGCGFGGTLALLDGMLSDVELTGLNIDARQIERARALVVPRPTNRLELVVGDACALPFASDRFDTVFAVESVFHFPSRERFFREARRVLRPGGRLVISDFIVHGPGYPALALLFLLHREAVERTYGTGEAWLPTLTAYRRLAARTGLTVRATRDVTRRTLPTYRVLGALADAMGEAGDRFRECNRFFELAARLRLHRYGILAFEKPK